MICQTLLSKVLKTPVSKHIQLENTSIIFQSFNLISEEFEDDSKNAFELASLCKDFAADNNFLINSFKLPGFSTWTAELRDFSNNRMYFKEGFASEPEAIFEIAELII